MRVRFACVSILIGVVCQTSAQTIAPPYENGVTAYEHFFAHVVCILTEHCFVGSPPTAPPLQRAFQNFVFTDQEVESLKAIVVDYERKNAAFLTVVGPLRSEARFQSIDSGQVSEELAKRIITLDGEHDQMVSDEIKRLKGAFGAERFDVLNSVVTVKNSKQPGWELLEHFSAWQPAADWQSAWGSVGARTAGLPTPRRMPSCPTCRCMNSVKML